MANTKRPQIHPGWVRWPLWVALLIGAATVAMVIFLVVERGHDKSHQDLLTDRLNALATLGEQNQARLQQLGQKPIGPPAKSVASGKATPPPTAQAPVTPGPPTTIITTRPTAGQVQAAVDAYFAAHPPKTPTPDMNKLTPVVADFVASYLRAHPAPAGKPGKNGASGKPGQAGHPGATGAPGAPGPAPTTEQISDAVTAFLPGAVADYLTANPPPPGPTGPPGPSGPAGPVGPQGPQGAQGDTGPGPTADQIKQAVSDYLTAHPLPPCPDGYTPTTETVVTANGPVTAQICVQPPPPPTTTTPPPT